AMRSYMRFARSLLVVCAPTPVLSSASVMAQAMARLRFVAAFGAGACAPFISGFAIPFFICTSTGMSCDFDVAQIYRAKTPSRNVSSERRRRFATYPRTPVRLYPSASFAKSRSMAHRETDVAKVFCECVNRLHQELERSRGFET